MDHIQFEDLGINLNNVHIGLEWENELNEPEDSDSESSFDSAETGGYEYEFVDQVSASQECPVCKLPMRDAVQTRECGHRFCRGCLEQTLRTAENCVCPSCRATVDEEGYYIDLAWARDILSLRVKCVQNVEGCVWAGEIRHIEEHENVCLYEKIECDDCGEFSQRRNMENHKSSECQQRIVQCQFCEEEFPFIDLEIHQETYCKRYPLKCTNECEHDPIPREEMADHLEMTCPMTIVKCSYVEVGCPYEEKRSHLSDHLESSIEEHLQLTSSELSRTQNIVCEMKKDYSYLAQSFKLLEEKHKALEKQQLEMKKSAEEMNTRVLLEDRARQARQREEHFGTRNSLPLSSRRVPYQNSKLDKEESVLAHGTAYQKLRKAMLQRRQNPITFEEPY